jgi:hypothetical protein
MEQRHTKIVSSLARRCNLVLWNIKYRTKEDPIGQIPESSRIIPWKEWHQQFYGVNCTVESLR